MRLAIELGGERARVAVADSAGGPARILPALAGSPADALAAAARRLGSAADPVDRVVVVHPTHWTGRAVAEAVGQVGVPGVAVCPRPAALAAAEEAVPNAAHPPGPLGVLELGPRTTSASVLGSGPSRVLLACRHVAEAPEEPQGHAVAMLTAVLAAARLAPEALTGGVLLLAAPRQAARLREPLTDLTGEPPLAPPDPGDLALLGALRPTSEPSRGLPRSVWARAGPDGRDPTPGRSSKDTSVQPLLPPPTRGGRARAVLSGVAVSLTAAALTAWTSGLLTGQAPAEAPRAGAETGQPAPADPPAGLLAQYDYVLRLPAGWRHSGGLPERRRTLLTPVDRPAGSDLIAVEQSPLGFDSAAEPGRALRELHAEHQRAVAAGSRLSDLAGSVPVGDRRAITYHQQQPAIGAEVDWYVLFERDAQLSVGCQHTPAGVAAVRSACEQVLGSVRLR